MPAKIHVAVIGAGAFGGWTALSLLRRGACVTLLDAWGAGNARSSSGGETRIMRAAYGPDQPYTRMSARALQLWKEHEQRWQQRFLNGIGVLWLVTASDDAYERDSLPLLREARIRYEALTAADVKKRFPQINSQDVRWAIYEPDGGFLTARNACRAVLEGFVAEGGEFRQLAVLPEGIEDGCRHGLVLSDGSRLSADRYVFACGPWLGQLFPQTLANRIHSTKQDVFFFGPPPGDDRFCERALPVWADHSERFLYGIPASDGRGFKMADDTRGPAFDPTTGERIVSTEALNSMRDYLEFRFPGMKDAPLLETRVCQYENSPDNNFMIDRHPAAESVWIVGGGSGHGFKHGPAVGEMVAKLLMEEGQPEALFSLARLENQKPGRAHSR